MKHLDKCDARHWELLREHEVRLVSKMSLLWRRWEDTSAHGAFVHSCWSHVEAESKGWNDIVVGGLTMQEAMTAWWEEDAARRFPASKHLSLGCYHLDGKCNPTCTR
jgi:hypothetical protein